MKNILISIRPEWCEKILNGKKTIEIRKTIPNCELPAKVYIYCTKGDKYLCLDGDMYFDNNDDKFKYYTMFATHKKIKYPFTYFYNSKVVAEFTLNSITEIFYDGESYYNFTIDDEENSCLNIRRLEKYGNGKTLYGWQIDDLIIYDNPKKLLDFMVTDEEEIKKCPYRSRVYYKNSNNGIIPTSYACDCCNKEDSCQINWCNKCLVKPLEKAPQSWCYVKYVKEE